MVLFSFFKTNALLNIPLWNAKLISNSTSVIDDIDAEIVELIKQYKAAGLAIAKMKLSMCQGTFGTLVSKVKIM
jgi:hypothetical protein